MFSVGEVTAVRAGFALAGYEGELRTLPVDSEDELIFVLDRQLLLTFDERSLEQGARRAACEPSCSPSGCARSRSPR
jgi:hypothetical protein